MKIVIIEMVIFRKIAAIIYRVSSKKPRIFSVIIYVIFHQNDNLGFKIEVLKFLGIQPNDTVLRYTRGMDIKCMTWNNQCMLLITEKSRKIGKTDIFETYVCLQAMSHF